MTRRSLAQGLLVPCAPLAALATWLLATSAAPAAGPPPKPGPYWVVSEKGRHPVRAALSADGRWLATFDFGGKPNPDPRRYAGWVYLYEVPKRRLARTFPVGAYPVSGGVLSFSADGKLLLAGSDRLAEVFDIPTGKSHRRFVLPELRAAVLLTPDGKNLVVKGSYETAALYSLKTGNEVAVLRCPDPLPKPGDKPPKEPEAWAKSPFANVTYRVALAPDGKFLAVGTVGAAVSVWDLKARKRLWRRDAFGGRVELLAFSADGKELAAVGRVPNSFSRLHVYGASKGSLESRASWVWDDVLLAGLPGGEWLVAGSEPLPRSSDPKAATRATKLALWDEDVTVRRHWKAPGVRNVQNVAVSADGKWAVLSCGAPERHEVWRLDKLFTPKKK